MGCGSPFRSLWELHLVFTCVKNPVCPNQGNKAFEIQLEVKINWSLLKKNGLPDTIFAVKFVKIKSLHFSLHTTQYHTRVPNSSGLEPQNYHMNNPQPSVWKLKNNINNIKQKSFRILFKICICDIYSSFPLLFDLNVQCSENPPVYRVLENCHHDNRPSNHHKTIRISLSRACNMIYKVKTLLLLIWTL